LRGAFSLRLATAKIVKARECPLGAMIIDRAILLDTGRPQPG
jgi:hypothetical protein